MKKTLRFSLLSMLMLVCGMTNAETVTLDFTTDGAYGLTATSDGNTYVTDATTITESPITIVLDGKFRLWSGSSIDLRLYNGNTMTISIDDGYAITAIDMNGSKLSNQTADIGTYDSGDWSGNASEIVFTQTGTVQISTMEITYSAADDETDTDEGNDSSTEEEEESESEDEDGTYRTYVKATEFEAGVEYLIVAQRDDATRYAYPLSSSYSYGYLSTGYVSGYVDTINVSTDYQDGFIFTANGDGYNLQDVENGRYYGQSGTYNSFQISDETAIWYVTAQDDGTFKIECNDYYIQWGDGTYTTFGIYPDAQDGTVMPYLYKLVSDESTDADTDTEEEEEEEESTSKTYAKTTDFEEGVEYLIVAQRDDETRYGYPINESYSYGYIYTSSIDGYVDTITVTGYEDGFIFTACDDGYNLQDVEYGRYYGQSGTYNSFQISDETAIWYVSAQDDGTFKIECNSYYIQWGIGSYTTFGIYPEAQDGAVMPYLYKLVSDGSTDGITSVTVSSDKTADSDAPIYNLAGQRVSKDTKGILIQNGKKFINR